MTEEEEFFAWLDGELEGEAAARVERRVGADPALQAMAEEHRALGANLRAAFDGVMTDATPAPLFEPEAELIREPANDNRLLGRFGAMAAGLAAAFFLGIAVGPTTDESIVAMDGSQLVAAASLHSALDQTLASAPEGDTRIALTYRDREGRICRSFSGAAASGLACRDGGSWEIEGLFGTENPGGDYRMASGADPQLAELVDATIDGEPFDAEAERAARESGWR